MIDWTDEAAAALLDVVTQLPHAPTAEQMRSLGLLDLCLPEAAGGIGMGAEALARVLEALACRDAGTAAWLYGNGAAQLAWYQQGMTDGDALMPGRHWAWPGFHDLLRHAWPSVDRHGLVSGYLSACLGGLAAEEVVTPVRLPDGHLVLFRLETAQPGVVRRSGVRYMGLQAAGMADLHLTEVRGQLQDQRLDDPLQGHGRRLGVQLSACVMAMMCGLMKGSLQTAQAYAAERHQGGGNLLGWGEVRRLLAVQHERLVLAQAALSSALRALALQADEQEAASRTQALLLQCGDAATAMATDGVQLLGGNGYMKDYGQASRLCDAWQLQGLMGPAAQRRQDLLALCMST